MRISKAITLLADEAAAQINFYGEGISWSIREDIKDIDQSSGDCRYW
jgi:hypothetical protein